MNDQEPKNRLAEAYDRMLEQVKHTLSGIGHEAGPTLHNALENARETATELGELSREEAEKVAGYLRRDLQDAGLFLAREGEDLGGWLSFDVNLVERSLLEMFMEVADRTKVELQRFALEADAGGEWHSGEVAGPGTLQCKSCGEELHLHRTAHIPPCPRCRGTTFRRISRGE